MYQYMLLYFTLSLLVEWTLNLVQIKDPKVYGFQGWAKIIPPKALLYHLNIDCIETSNFWQIISLKKKHMEMQL
jgi:hypothetical protein